MVPFFRSLNLILSFPRLLENATAAIEPDFGRLFGPRLGSSHGITLQGVSGRRLAGPFGDGLAQMSSESTARSAAWRPIDGFARQFYFCSQICATVF